MPAAVISGAIPVAAEAATQSGVPGAVRATGSNIGADGLPRRSFSEGWRIALL